MRASSRFGSRNFKITSKCDTQVRARSSRGRSRSAARRRAVPGPVLAAAAVAEDGRVLERRRKRLPWARRHRLGPHSGRRHRGGPSQTTNATAARQSTRPSAGGSARDPATVAGGRRALLLTVVHSAPPPPPPPPRGPAALCVREAARRLASARRGCQEVALVLLHLLTVDLDEAVGGGDDELLRWSSGSQRVAPA